MSAKNDLEGPRTKIDRAKDHARELEREIEAFLQRDPYRVMLLTDQHGNQTLACDVKELVPSKWGLIAGDALHNARASLDLLANVLVERDGGRSGDASFPISNTSDVFQKAAPKSLRGASDTTVRKIEELQPFNTGNADLRTLHVLDIIDKHKTAIVTASAGSAQNITARQRGTGGTMSLGFASIDTTKLGVSPMGLAFSGMMGMVFDPAFRLRRDVLLIDADRRPIGDAGATVRRLIGAAEAVINTFDV
ncbi:hypothetical protein sos41_31190 [Alphaproteobacteria bacterium SO-S41]|nr:hypothetical protein sos41_31190 [Alphaproteobacteria bacterium SO-S41]